LQTAAWLISISLAFALLIIMADKLSDGTAWNQPLKWSLVAAWLVPFSLILLHARGTSAAA
jgi:hypothetical protein